MLLTTSWIHRGRFQDCKYRWVTLRCRPARLKDGSHVPRRQQTQFLSAKTRLNYSRTMGRDGDGERSVLVIHVKAHHLSEAESLKCCKAHRQHFTHRRPKPEWISWLLTDVKIIQIYVLIVQLLFVPNQLKSTRFLRLQRDSEMNFCS